MSPREVFAIPSQPLPEPPPVSLIAQAFLSRWLLRAEPPVEPIHAVPPPHLLGAPCGSVRATAGGGAGGHGADAGAVAAGPGPARQPAPGDECPARRPLSPLLPPHSGKWTFAGTRMRGRGWRGPNPHGGQPASTFFSPLADPSQAVDPPKGSLKLVWGQPGKVGWTGKNSSAKEPF